MIKPYRYAVHNLITGEWSETNIDPGYFHTHGYVPTKDDPNISIYQQTKQVYIDTRYEAKLRLYKYLCSTQNQQAPISSL